MHYRILATLLLLIAAGPAALAGTILVEAGTVSLVPPAGAVTPGNPFTVALVLDASDPAIPGTRPGLYSGEVVIDFDTRLLTYDGFTLGSGLSFYSPPAVVINGFTQTVHLGFASAAETGTVGTFAFTAIGGPGSVTLGLADGDPIPPGSFVNMLGTNARFKPEFSGAQVTVVPAPAGLWLLGTAVGALVIRRQLRHAAG